MTHRQPINVGKYRVDPMDVVTGSWGREKVHYHAQTAEDVPAEMQRFLDWFNSDATSKDYVKSAIAHFWFRNVPYGIVISKDLILTPCPEGEGANP